MTWNPGLYLNFGDQRARPGHDLIARIPIAAPGTITDLGAGTGGLTADLARRWPEARVIGLDSSPEMLARAAADHPQLTWVAGDIAAWQPAAPPDLIFSNAALHWVADHAALFPRLMRALAPGGVLAVQMPANFDQPSHRLMAEVAGDGPWAEHLAAAGPRWPVLQPAAYYDVLKPFSDTMDIWETTYLQVLSGPDPVLKWVRATGLRAYLDPLPEADRPRFEAIYRERLSAAYPARSDGTTLFPFRRMFIVAQAAPA